MFLTHFKTALCLLLMLSWLCGCSVSHNQSALIGKPAPKSRYFLMDGTSHGISALQDKVVVLAFWDATCSHCKHAMPELNELAQSFLNEDKILFLAISINSQSEENILKSRIKELGLSALTHAFSGNDVYDETFQAYQGESIPYFVILNHLGHVSWVGHDVSDLREVAIELLRKK